MTVLSRKTVRKEVGAGLETVLVGTGLPCAAVYSYQVGKLGGMSPVVEVLSGTINRPFAGMGTKRYESDMTLEIHILVYDGQVNQPFTDEQKEDAADDIEAIVAQWVADHQRGTNYRAVRFAEEQSQRAEVKMLDGNPYMIEILKLEVEAPDL